ncbi:hypothetical protein Q3G72_003982 [Acer saccharum]|nr:hypothetical protein Q3G72_003982 [Acer saccharum]
MITRLTFDLTPTLQSHCLWHFSFDSFTFSEDYFCSLRAPHYARLTLIDSIDSSPPPNSSTGPPVILHPIAVIKAGGTDSLEAGLERNANRELIALPPIALTRPPHRLPFFIAFFQAGRLGKHSRSFPSSLSSGRSRLRAISFASLPVLYISSPIPCCRIAKNWFSELESLKAGEFTGLFPYPKESNGPQTYRISRANREHGQLRNHNRRDRQEIKDES